MLLKSGKLENTVAKPAKQKVFVETEGRPFGGECMLAACRQ